jgi:hypothetical protein
MNDKIIVITSDNREIILDKKLKEFKYYEFSFIINSVYCYKKKINFKYLKIKDIYSNIFFNSKDTISSYSSIAKNTRSASWTKLLCIYSYLKKNYDYIIYMDSDCIFYNQKLSLNKLISKIKKEKKLGLLYSDKPWNCNLPNAGFMILRNSKYTKKLIKFWWNSKDYLNSHKHPYEQKKLHEFWASNTLNIKKNIIFIKKNISSIKTNKNLIYHITSNYKNRENIFKKFIKEKKININYERKKIQKNIKIFDPKNKDIIMNNKKNNLQDYFIILLNSYILLPTLLTLKKFKNLMNYL